MTGFTISEFAGKLSSHGLASPNKFKVEFTKIPVTDNDSLLNFMCETVEIAGRSVQSMLDIQYGIRREVVYNAPTYNPLSMTFICSGKLKEKRILDTWNNMTVDTSRGSDVAYYKSYASGILKVTTLAVDGKTPTHTVEYHEVYPKTVQSIPLNHSTQNSVLRVTAEFQYAYWLTKDTNNRSSGPAFGNVG